MHRASLFEAELVISVGARLVRVNALGAFAFFFSAILAYIVFALRHQVVLFLLVSRVFLVVFIIVLLLDTRLILKVLVVIINFGALLRRSATCLTLMRVQT